MYGSFIELPESIAQSPFGGFRPGIIILPSHFLKFSSDSATAATPTTKKPQTGETAINSSTGTTLAMRALYRLRLITQPLDK